MLIFAWEEKINCDETHPEFGNSTFAKNIQSMCSLSDCVIDVNFMSKTMILYKFKS